MAFEAGAVVSATAAWGPKTTAGSIAARINAIMPTGWSFVENIPAGTGAGQSGSAANACDVFKSSSANNDAGIDFWIGVYYATATGALIELICAADYLDIAGNPANADRGKFRRQCTRPATGTAPDGTTFAFNETYTTCAGIVSTTTDFSPAVATTGFSYWLKMTANFLYICIKSGSTISFSYTGLMDSTVTGSTDNRPLVSINSTTGGFATLPGVTGSAGGSAMWGATGVPWNTLLAGLLTQSFTNTDFWMTSRVIATRLAMVHDVTAANSTTYGLLRGLLKADILVITAGTNTLLPGDTITIAGNTWTIVSSSTGLTGSAAVANGLTSLNHYVVTRAN